MKDIIATCFKNIRFESLTTREDALNISTELKVKILEHKEHILNLIIAHGYGQLIDELEEFQKNCPINPTESLWFIQGHCAFDDIIVPYFNKIIQILAKNLADKAKSKEKQNHWNKRSESKQSYRDVLSLNYRNCLSPSQECRFFRQIQDDIQTDFLK